MSVENFIPTIWSAAMLKERERKYVAINNCNRNYEGDIKQKGDTVKISGIGEITISNYTKNNFDTGLALQTLDDQSTVLQITESKYFNFALDDVDKAQSNANLMQEAMRKSGMGLNNVADQFIFAKYAESGLLVTEASLTSANITSRMTEALRKLYEKDVPEGEDIVFEISPLVYEKLVLAKIVRDTDNSATLQNGKVGSYMGVTINLSNNIVQVGSESHCIMRTKDAVSYAEQIREVKAYQLGKEGFGDAVKGLMLYGAKVVKPKEMVHLDLTVAAETAI